MSAARRGRSTRALPRGMTLVEVIVAIVVMSVGMLAVAGSLVGASGLRRLSGSRLELANQAEAKVEELQKIALSWANADSLQLSVGGSLTTAVANHADTTVSPYGGTLLRYWTVAPAAAGTWDVTVRVRPSAAINSHMNRFDVSTRLLR
jgi:prepilin-type N-terminal cleavage/methylation domain-containing protein